MKSIQNTKFFKSAFFLFTLIALVGAGCKENGSDPDPIDSESEISNRFSLGEKVGQIQSAEINEASGLVESRTKSGVLFTHNDSGGEPKVYAIDKEGKTVSTLTLSGATNRDWEDIAAGPGPENDVSYVFVGDIGDNNAVRENLVIYRFVEPNMAADDLADEQTIQTVEAIKYKYENGARDAETLMVDPQTKDIYIVSKREAKVGLYVLAYPQSTTEMNTAKFVTEIPYTYFTGGEISPDGSEILIKNYFSVYYWPRNNGQTVGEALAELPEKLQYNSEPQGEAICFATDGSGYFTVSEKDGSKPVPVLFYKRN